MTTTNEKQKIQDIIKQANWGAETGEQVVGIINRINSNNRNNSSNRTDNSHITDEAKISSNRTSSPLELTYDLFDTEEFLDSRGGIGGADHQPKFRDYDEEIKELKINQHHDIKYAKVSLWEPKPNQYLISFAYINNELFGNKIQQIQFSLASNKHDFLHNLNSIWGPNTRKRPTYERTATALKNNVLDYAGKGRQANNYRKNKQMRQALLPESVCGLKSKDDCVWVFIHHHGFQHQFRIDKKSDFTTPQVANKPIATKEYWRSDYDPQR